MANKQWQCCVSGCTDLTDISNTSFCAKHMAEHDTYMREAFNLFCENWAVYAEPDDIKPIYENWLNGDYNL